MATPAKREPASPLADLFDWFEEGFPTMAAWRTGTSRMRVEDFEENDRYVVRAELPGIDPDKDVEITVTGGVLTIRAERREQQKDKHRSEFRYGRFERRLSLPAGATEEDVVATYDDGILTVSVPTGQPETESRRIPVMRPSED
jgi:HSP20 family protein